MIHQNSICFDPESIATEYHLILKGANCQSDVKSLLIRIEEREVFEDVLNCDHVLDYHFDSLKSIPAFPSFKIVILLMFHHTTDNPLALLVIILIGGQRVLVTPSFTIFSYLD